MVEVTATKFADTPGFSLWKAGVYSAGSGLGLIGLYFYDPAQLSNSPAAWLCPFHVLSGLACPACGATRAFHQLLHLNLVEAAHLNVLLVLLIPLLVWVWWGVGRAWWGGTAWTGLRISANQLKLLLAITLSFTVLRNLPLSPFNWLSPF